MKNEFEKTLSQNENIVLIESGIFNNFLSIIAAEFLRYQLFFFMGILSKVILVFAVLFSVGTQVNAQSRVDKSGELRNKGGVPGLEAAKVPSGISFPSTLEKVYGDINYELGEEVDKDGYQINYFAEDTTILRIMGNVAIILKAGETKVFAELSELKHISNVVPLTQELKVHPKALHINVLPNQKKIFGEVDPKLQFEAKGLIYGEGNEVISGGVTRESGENAGKYQITMGDLNAGVNYQVIFSAADFEITQRELSVQAKSVSKYFGTNDPELGYEVKGMDSEESKKLVTGQIKRQVGEKIGMYEIEVGDLKVSANYSLKFEEATFEIKSTELSAVYDLKGIETIWSVMPEFPTHISALTIDGQILNLPVSWAKNDLNLLEKGNHSITGEIALREGILNPQQLKAIQKVTILSKPSPKNVELSQTKFEPISSLGSLEVGQFTVEDELDNSHSISLIAGRFDNSHFEINGSSLYWKNTSNSNVNTHYSILVQVKDRVGNILEKEFKLTTEFSHIDKIHVHNVFTPNNDGYNDTWGIPSTAEGIQVRVFNKNGNLLFETENSETQWDGTYLGKNLPPDTYFWMISSKRTGESRKGFLSILL